MLISLFSDLTVVFTRVQLFGCLVAKIFGTGQVCLLTVNPHSVLSQTIDEHTRWTYILDRLNRSLVIF